MSLGIMPVEHVTVADDLEAHAAAFERLAERVDLIVCSGGLGPTADDMTRSALAKASRDELVEDELSLAQIEAWFGARGRSMPPMNRTQAMRPSRGVSLPNLNGTAPGLYARVETRDQAVGCGTSNSTSEPGFRVCDVFCLPGPPREMMPMFESQVSPRLVPPPGRAVKTRVLHCIGIGESDLATRLGELMNRNGNPLVGTTASGGVVSIRMRYVGVVTSSEADRILDETERSARAAAGVYCFGSGTDTLAGVVIGTLRHNKKTLAVVESCTGGMLGSMLTDVPGASNVFVGGWMTYSNRLKETEVGVDPRMFEKDGPGAVSAECAREMARGGLAKSGADFCISVTGIAGPEGGTRDKPVGTVFIGLARRNNPEPDIRRFNNSGDRNSIRDWSAKQALAVLWLHVSGNPHEKLLRQA